MVASIFTFVVIAINVMNKKQMTEYILKHYYGMPQCTICLEKYGNK